MHIRHPPSPTLGPQTKAHLRYHLYISAAPCLLHKGECLHSSAHALTHPCSRAHGVLSAQGEAVGQEGVAGRALRGRAWARGPHVGGRRQKILRGRLAPDLKEGPIRCLVEMVVLALTLLSTRQTHKRKMQELLGGLCAIYHTKVGHAFSEAACSHSHVVTIGTSTRPSTHHHDHHHHHHHHHHHRSCSPGSWSDSTE